MSPLIPKDVIEEIIDSVHELGDVKSLRNLALTSRSFLRRSKYHLFSSHICFGSIQKLNSFCDFLDAHPDRRSWVKSVTISNTKECPSMQEVVPVRLLANLPSLEKWNVSVSNEVYYTRGDRWISSNTPKLTCLRHYAQSITQLHLDRVSFQSCADLVRYILAFPSLCHLQCKWLEFQRKDHATALIRARERLCKELQLSHLTIKQLPCVAVTLLLESAQYTLQELVIDMGIFDMRSGRLDLYASLPTLVPRLSKLSSITLRVCFVNSDFGNGEPRDDIIQHVVEILKALPSNPDSLIAEVVVHLYDHQISKLLKYLQKHTDDLAQICRTLETALLRLPHLQKVELCHGLRRPLRTWTPTRLEHLLPTLHKRGLIDTRCIAPPVQGHSYKLSALVVSPDGRWIASGSEDMTIILWDAQRGAIVHEWLVHLDYYVTSFAFSQDGRYLASVGYDRKVMVWDVSEVTETKLVATLEDVDVCVWLPDGTAIRASGGSKGTVQVWNPSTSQVQWHPLEGYPEKLESHWCATISPDGRWTAMSRSLKESQWSMKIWDATTGRLHRVLSGLTHYVDLDSGRFDPTGRRIVIPSGEGADDGPDGEGEDDSDDWHAGTARIWDVETGVELAVLEGHEQSSLCNITFSPDETRVLSIGSDSTMVRLWDSFSGDKAIAVIPGTREYDRASVLLPQWEVRCICVG